MTLKNKKRKFAVEKLQKSETIMQETLTTLVQKLSFVEKRVTAIEQKKPPPLPQTEIKEIVLPQDPQIDEH